MLRKKVSFQRLRTRHHRAISVSITKLILQWDATYQSSFSPSPLFPRLFHRHLIPRSRFFTLVGASRLPSFTFSNSFLCRASRKIPLAPGALCSQNPWRTRATRGAIRSFTRTCIYIYEHRERGREREQRVADVGAACSIAESAEWAQAVFTLVGCRACDSYT